MEGQNNDSQPSPLLLQLKISSLEHYLLYSDQSDMQVFAQQVPVNNTWRK